jgi:hypothetical protein
VRLWLRWLCIGADPGTLAAVQDASASGSTIKVHVTDMVNPKLMYTDSSYTSGMIGVRSWGSHVHFNNINVVAF